MCRKHLANVILRPHYRREPNHIVVVDITYYASVRAERREEGTRDTRERFTGHGRIQVLQDSVSKCAGLVFVFI